MSVNWPRHPPHPRHIIEGNTINSVGVTADRLVV